MQGEVEVSLKRQIRGLDRYRREMESLEERDPAEHHRRRVAAATRRMPEAMRGVMGRYGMENERTSSRNPIGRIDPRELRWPDSLVRKLDRVAVQRRSREVSLSRAEADALLGDELYGVAVDDSGSNWFNWRGSQILVRSASGRVAIWRLGV